MIIIIIIIIVIIIIIIVVVVVLNLVVGVLGSLFFITSTPTTTRATLVLLLGRVLDEWLGITDFGELRGEDAARVAVVADQGDGRDEEGEDEEDKEGDGERGACFDRDAGKVVGSQCSCGNKHEKRDCCLLPGLEHGPDEGKEDDKPDCVDHDGDVLDQLVALEKDRCGCHAQHVRCKHLRPQAIRYASNKWPQRARNTRASSSTSNSNIQLGGGGGVESSCVVMVPSRAWNAPRTTAISTASSYGIFASEGWKGIPSNVNLGEGAGATISTSLS